MDVKEAVEAADKKTAGHFTTALALFIPRFTSSISLTLSSIVYNTLTILRSPGDKPLNAPA
jgi:hypothetical protein